MNTMIIKTQQRLLKKNGSREDNGANNATYEDEIKGLVGVSPVDRAG